MNVDLSLAIQYAQQCYPDESVGIVVEDKYIPLINEAQDKSNDCHVSTRTLARYGMNNIQAVIHSHPTTTLQNDRSYPSKRDMQAQEQFNVPFCIISCTEKGYNNPTWFGFNNNNLLGRNYIYGVTDCYSLIRDYYRVNLSIELPIYPRDWLFWEDGQDMYSDCFQQAGFVKVNDLRKHDLVLFSLTGQTIREKRVSHGAVYIGDNKIMHHLGGDLAVDNTRLSCIESLDKYKDYQQYIIRHKDLI